MGDVGDIYKIVKENKKERKRLYGINCPDCNKKQPKRIPTRLLPGQKCKVCGYTFKKERAKG